MTEKLNLNQNNIMQELYSEKHHLSRVDLARYAGASLDFNPIHYSDKHAKSVDLPGVIAHGMLTMGLAISTLTKRIDSIAQLKSYQVRFTKPIVVDSINGADIEVSAKLQKIDPEKNIAVVALNVTFEGNKVITKALAELQIV